MKNKYFYIFMLFLAGMLLFSGCGETTADEMEAATESTEETQINQESTAETTVTTLTPLQTLEQITKVTDMRKTETKKTSKATAAKETQKTEETEKVPDDWFSANTIFRMTKMEERNFERETEEDDDENTTTVSTGEVPSFTIIDKRKYE